MFMLKIFESALNYVERSCDVENSEVARVLYEIADFLELQGIAFKPQAYRKAARNVEQLDGDIMEYCAQGRLNEVPGVGKAIAEKIGELVNTGRLRYLEKLRAEIPSGVLELLQIPEIGPKTAMILHKELGIIGIRDLKDAIFNHRLSGLKGFGTKTEERILQGIRVFESKAGRILLSEAFIAASTIISYLQEQHKDVWVSAAGSLRRMRETIGDIDILVASSLSQEIMDTFVSFESVADILAKGDTKSSVRLSNGIQVDLRIVPEESYGAALQYFTGSKEHNVALRKLAISKGMKISEYGLFNRETNDRIAGGDEADVYRSLDLEYIPPELRENRGEIEAARKDSLPKLVEYDELKGDLHCHTEWSDGLGTIKEIWAKASSLRYDYVGIADHSQLLRIANGLSEARLLEQNREIGKLRESLGPPWIFSGSEVDVLQDGKLDYPKKALERLDFAIMSIHTRFKMGEKEMTERIVSAMSNEKVKMFAHPTGRIIGQRPSYTFDFERVVDAAIQNGIALEINAFPERLDLNDLNVKRAIDLGAKIVINSDAHAPVQLNYVRFGIAVARRGWAEGKDITNTKPFELLRKEWGLS